jgi:predicted transcriptional regulator
MLISNQEANNLVETIKEKTFITSVARKEIDLLSRHINVLTTVRDHGPIGIIRLSQVIGQPQHIIRYSLRTLEKGGVIKPSPNGAVVTDKIHEALGTLDSTFDEISTTMNDLKKKIK